MSSYIARSVAEFLKMVSSNLYYRNDTTNYAPQLWWQHRVQFVLVRNVGWYAERHDHPGREEQSGGARPPVDHQQHRQRHQEQLQVGRQVPGVHQAELARPHEVVHKEQIGPPVLPADGVLGREKPKTVHVHVEACVQADGEEQKVAVDRQQAQQPVQQLVGDVPGVDRAAASVAQEVDAQQVATDREEDLHQERVARQVGLQAVVAHQVLQVAVVLRWGHAGYQEAVQHNHQIRSRILTVKLTEIFGWYSEALWEAVKLRSSSSQSGMQMPSSRKFRR
uniref:Uncharacterized protein n=1 Tax=Anopheles atroparvus TaxID=41427 RepID=A0A182IQE2_ANOAO